MPPGAGQGRLAEPVWLIKTASVPQGAILAGVPCARGYTRLHRCGATQRRAHHGVRFDPHRRWLKLAVTAVVLAAALGACGTAERQIATGARPGRHRAARDRPARRARRHTENGRCCCTGLTSADGRTYRERIETVTTERQLSVIFEDFIDMVPLGRKFFASSNPVRTGGPMQVSVTFAEEHACKHPYPYPVQGSIRHEVFTRRGGIYFGMAHLLAHEAPYKQPLYRFADFNAGHYASRNAAFQNAVSVASGIPLVLDGGLLPPDAGSDKPAGSTELAAASMAGRIEMSAAAIRRDLNKGDQPGFERTGLSKRVFALAEQLDRRPLPEPCCRASRYKAPRSSASSPPPGSHNGSTNGISVVWLARPISRSGQSFAAAPGPPGLCRPRQR